MIGELWCWLAHRSDWLRVHEFLTKCRRCGRGWFG